MFEHSLFELLVLTAQKSKMQSIYLVVTKNTLKATNIQAFWLIKRSYFYELKEAEETGKVFLSVAFLMFLGISNYTKHSNTLLLSHCVHICVWPFFHDSTQSLSITKEAGTTQQCERG